jgi:CMP-N-acetylneuraminic acid synthetase
MKGICFIPARGGSQRIPRKNIREFCGTTLLDLTLRSVIDSNAFEKIILSSDDPEILEKASQYSDVELHTRQPELSDDKATVFSVFHHLLLENPGYDFMGGVLVTSPFKNANHIQGAVNLYKKENGNKNVISVTNFDYPPQFGFQINRESGELKMLFPEVFAKTTNSKFMEAMCHNNGVIWVGSTKNYLENKTFYKGSLVGYEMDSISSFDIDYPYQFEIAEMIYKKNNTHEKH